MIDISDAPEALSSSASSVYPRKGEILSYPKSRTLLP